MNALELKIPPVIVAGLAVGAAWLIRDLLPNLTLLRPNYFAIIPLLVFGAGFAVIGLYQFARARTTVDPHRPEKTNTLVTEGIYSVLRNPMYLGIFFFLAAIVVYLGNLAGVIVLPAFVAYMNRFQILPEERTLAEKFGEEYMLYVDRTRRWL
ncbi:MAG: isoprenylcysteine carboxylmethyltransferase family protein [Rhodothermales bacterium]|nr:isoprenylcysteine carboxylmethyltransferase family protein [Rhodothermales bacterium]MBO6779280.1 isoprenylcysteine carboxylmethyltransferase family protein [Rhodothermales bacterium]